MARFLHFHALSFELNFFFDRRCPLTKIPFLKRLIGIFRLIDEILNDQNF